MIEQSSKPRSRTCPKCNTQNRIGVVFCETCGTPITTSARNATSTSIVPEDVANRLGQINQGMRKSREIDMPKRTRHAKPEIGNAIFHPGYQLSISFTDGHTPLMIGLEEGMTLVFGRNDPDDYYEPEIDLIPFDGYRHGISRRHAAIRLHRRRLEITDLKSSNGTLVNGERLGAGTPLHLRSGDEVRMGSLRMIFSFIND